MSLGFDRIDLPEQTNRKRLERIVARFETACGSGSWPRIEDYLPDDGDRRAILVELIHADLEFRLRAGEPSRTATYLERFPELTDDDARELLSREASLRGRSGQISETRLGRFELGEVAGRGAHAVVYRGYDTELGRPVAIKVLLSGGPSPDDAAARFLREARHLARLRHPGIVTVHEAGQIDGFCVLVSEFIEGTTLAGLLTGGRLEARRAAELTAGVAEALHHAHDQGIIHRDVKPSNVLLDRRGRPYLADFGLARHDGTDATLTVDGQVLGTPAYMSPELARGEAHRVDARSDIYSLGVILYELLTGAAPFLGSPRRVLAQILEHDPRPPRRLVETIPRDLETICLKAMAKESRHRYASAGALADDLRRFLRHEPVRARSLGPLARLWRRGRRRPLVAALILAAGLAGLGMAWQGWRARVNLIEARHQQARFRHVLVGSSAVMSEIIRLERRRTRDGRLLSDVEVRPILSRLDRRIALLSDDPTALPMLAAAHDQAAALLLMAGRRGEARTALQRCADLLERQVAAAPDDPRTLLNLVDVLDRLATNRREDGDADEARRLALRAIDIERRAVPILRARAHEAPGVLSPWKTLTNECGRLAFLLIETGQTAEAIAWSREAWACREVASRADPGNTTVCFQLIRLGSALADHHPKAGRSAQVVPELVRLRRLRENAVRSRPGDLSDRVTLAKSDIKLAEARYRVGQLAEALPDYERGRAILEELGTTRPPGSRSWLALACVGIGRIEDRRDHPAEAIDAFRRAADLYAGLAREQPANPHHRVGLAMCHHVIGNLFMDLKQPAEAVAAYRLALTLREAIVHDWPDSTAYHNDLAGTTQRLTEARAALTPDHPTEPVPGPELTEAADRSTSESG